VLVRRDGYLASLRKALEDDKMAEPVMASFAWENMSVAINTPRNGSNTPAVGFTGDLSAKIGFLLDFAAVSAASDTADDTDTVAEDESDDQEGPDMPWVLEGCGFDMTNVLLWTFNFKRFSTLTAKDLSKSSDGNADLLESHRALITASQARVLLICGPRAEQAVSALAKSTKIYTLEARGLRYKMRILEGYGDIRLCIRCPELPSRSWSCSLEHQVQLSEAIKLAIMLTNTKAIRPYFVEGAGVLSWILCRARAERVDPHFPRLTTETLDPGLRLWLARKGLKTDQDIRDIERSGGSLIRGLLMVLHALPRRGTGVSLAGQESVARDPKKRVRFHEKFDEEGFRDVKRLVTDRHQQRQAQMSKEPSFASPSTPTVFLQATLGNAESEDYLEPDKDGSLETADKDGPLETADEDGFLEPDEDGFLEPDEDGSPEMADDDGPEEGSSSYAAMQEFAAMGEEDRESIEKMHSLLTTRRGSAAESDAGDDEGLVESLTSLVHEMSHALDIRRQARPRTYQQKTTRWREEVGEFRNKEYTGRILAAPSSGPVTHHQQYRRLVLNYCSIHFPREMDIRDNKVYIKIEMSDPGRRHPDCYATAATDEDPACRLAFRVRYVTSSGNNEVFYPKDVQLTNVFRANSFADILLGRSDLDIAQTPRRYLYTSVLPENLPKELAKFSGGAYTSLRSQREQQQAPRHVGDTDLAS